LSIAGSFIEGAMTIQSNLDENTSKQPTSQQELVLMDIVGEDAELSDSLSDFLDSRCETHPIVQAVGTEKILNTLKNVDSDKCGSVISSSPQDYVKFCKTLIPDFKKYYLDDKLKGKKISEDMDKKVTGHLEKKVPYFLNDIFGTILCRQDMVAKMETVLAQEKAQKPLSQSSEEKKPLISTKPTGTVTRLPVQSKITDSVKPKPNEVVNPQVAPKTTSTVQTKPILQNTLRQTPIQPKKPQSSVLEKPVIKQPAVQKPEDQSKSTDIQKRFEPQKQETKIIPQLPQKPAETTKTEENKVSELRKRFESQKVVSQEKPQLLRKKPAEKTITESNKNSN
jgi:predicted GIY-YIG superfamily endonuclease